MAGLAAEYNLDDLIRTVEVSLVPTAMPNTIQDVSTYLTSVVKRRFASGTGPDGQTWDELKFPRHRRRDQNARGGTGQKPLYDSGVLMASASGQEGAAGAVKEMGAFHLVQGSNLDYAAIHNFGGVIHKPEQKAPTKRGKPFWAWLTPEGTWRYTKRIRAHDVTIPARPFVGLNHKDVDRIEAIALDNLAQGTP